ncbi:MAG TPA: hypothetical protein DHW02_03710 [Ktedonobacter sp.]|nr:hypothetical protein [Ktedonobacter sp.]
MPKPSEEEFTTYANAPSRISTLIQGLDSAALNYTPAEDEWSIHEILVHLADSELVGSWRIRRAIAEPGTTIQAYDEATWAKAMNYKHQNSSAALQLFSALRTSNTQLLRSLPDEVWEHSVVHSENGTMSLYDVFETYIRHIDTHIQQIEQLK